MDPVVDWLLRAALAWLFASAAVHKARDRAGFAATLDAYALLPRRIVTACVPLLVALEAGLALLLLIAPARPVAAASAVCLLGVYSLAIAINLRRGRRDIDCGCMGPAHRQPLSGWLLVRNGLLAGAAAAIALPPGDRALGAADAVSFFAGLAATGLLFVASNQLAGQASRAQALRRP